MFGKEADLGCLSSWMVCHHCLSTACCGFSLDWSAFHWLKRTESRSPASTFLLAWLLPTLKCRTSGLMYKDLRNESFFEWSSVHPQLYKIEQRHQLVHEVGIPDCSTAGHWTHTSVLANKAVTSPRALLLLIFLIGSLCDACVPSLLPSWGPYKNGNVLLFYMALVW